MPVSRVKKGPQFYYSVTYCWAGRPSSESKTAAERRPTGPPGPFAGQTRRSPRRRPIAQTFHERRSLDCCCCCWHLLDLLPQPLSLADFFELMIAGQGKEEEEGQRKERMSRSRYYKCNLCSYARNEHIFQRSPSPSNWPVICTD